MHAALERPRDSAAPCRAGAIRSNEVRVQLAGN
jgi:hypothetical protein